MSWSWETASPLKQSMEFLVNKSCYCLLPYVLPISLTYIGPGKLQDSNSGLWDRFRIFKGTVCTGDVIGRMEANGQPLPGSTGEKQGLREGVVGARASLGDTCDLWRMPLAPEHLPVVEHYLAVVGVGFLTPCDGFLCQHTS